MLNYDGRYGLYLKKHLATLGFHIWKENYKNGTSEWLSTDDLAVQPLIDGFDLLAHKKQEKIEALKQEARVRANALYPFIDPEKGEAEAFYQFASDLYLSIAPAARQPLSGSLLAFKNIKDAVTASTATINGYTTEAEVDAFDVVNTPSWNG